MVSLGRLRGNDRTVFFRDSNTRDAYWTHRGAATEPRETLEKAGFETVEAVGGARDFELSRQLDLAGSFFPRWFEWKAET